MRIIWCGLAQAVLRIDNNEPIKFLGSPTSSKGGSQTGNVEIWRTVLTELSHAVLAMEVQNAQALVSVQGFVAIEDELLAACDAMDK